MKWNLNNQKVLVVDKEENTMVSITEKEIKKLEALIEEAQSDLRSAIETAYFEGFEVGRTLNVNNVKKDDTKEYEIKRSRQTPQHALSFDDDYYMELYKSFRD